MLRLRSARWLLPVLLTLLIPASSHAGVFISVGFAPPPLVTYVQPPCPQPGLIWTPGYWAYGPEGYYWVPGAWVPAPYMGAYWTPGYWGWGNSLYMWHPGYWGPRVGYYGGINYGFGYFGVGFVGGMWRGNAFAYNTAVMRVNTTVIRNVYVDRTVIREHTIVDNHVAYNGGRGGIQYAPSPAERAAMNQPHMEATRFQQQHMQQAMQNRAAYFNNNHGRPAEAVSRQPLEAERRPAPALRNGGPMNGNRPMNNYGGARPNAMENRGGQAPAYRAPAYQGERGQAMQPDARGNFNNGMRPQQRQFEPQRPQQRQQFQRPENRPQQRPQARPQERPQPHGKEGDRYR